MGIKECLVKLRSPKDIKEEVTKVGVAAALQDTRNQLNTLAFDVGARPSAVTTLTSDDALGQFIADQANNAGVTDATLNDAATAKQQAEILYSGRRDNREVLEYLKGRRDDATLRDLYLANTLWVEATNNLSSDVASQSAVAQNRANFAAEVGAAVRDMRSNLGTKLHSLKEFQKAPFNLQQRVMEDLNRLRGDDLTQYRKLLRSNKKKAAEFRARAISARQARFVKFMEESGVDMRRIFDVTSNLIDNAMFAVVENGLQQSVRTSLADKVAALLTLAPRVAIFGPTSAATVGLASLANAQFTMLSDIVGNAAKGDVATAWRGVKAYPIATLAQPTKGLWYALKTIYTGRNAIITKLQGKEIDDYYNAAGVRSPAEVIAPGSATWKKLTRMALEFFPRAVGSADQLGQVALHTFYDATLKDGDYKNDALIKLLKDAGASRPFTDVNIKDEDGETKAFSYLGKAAATIERLVNAAGARNIWVRPFIAQVAPVYRGAIRGGEQAVRYFPVASALALGRDLALVRAAADMKVEDLVNKDYLVARAIAQLGRSVIAHSVPFILYAMMDDEDKREMEKGNIGNVSLLRAPLIGDMTQAYGAAMNAVNRSEYYEGLLKTADLVIEATMPMRRVLGTAGGWSSGKLEELGKETPLARVYQEYNQQKELGNSTLLSVVNSIAPARDLVALMSSDARKALNDDLEELDRRARADTAFGFLFRLDPAPEPELSDEEFKLVDKVVERVGDPKARSGIKRIVKKHGAELNPDYVDAWVEVEQHRKKHKLHGIGSEEEAEKKGKAREYEELERLRKMRNRIPKT